MRSSSRQHNGRGAVLEAVQAEARRRWLAGRTEQARLLAQSPTLHAQLALLRLLSESVEPILAACDLQTDFLLTPGARLRRRYGQCRHFSDGRPPHIAIRCTADGDATRWRLEGAIVLTLLHEAAHLRHRDHGRRFWALLRALVDQAAAAGIYDPADDDPREHARGDGKLAGSAAQPLAEAAAHRRLEQARANRRALAGLSVGEAARVTIAVGPLASAVVRVVGKLRTRFQVQGPDGRIYRVPAILLAPLEKSSGP